MTSEKQQVTKQNSASDQEALNELQLHQQSIKESTPLSIIREKEVQLKKYIIEMQIQADRINENAKKEAAQIKEKIAVEGEKKAQEYHKREITKIEKEAEEIKNNAPAQEKIVIEKGTKNIDKIIAQLKNILYPVSQK